MTWEIIAPGTWLIFGIVLLPVYLMLLGWFAGSPRDTGTAILGVGYLVGMTVLLWGGLLILTLLIGAVFF